MEGLTLPRIEAPIGIDREDEKLVQFAEKSLEEIAEQLEDNRERGHSMTDIEKSVDDVLAPHNTRSLEIRARRLENPKVTLWLKGCPLWANDAWTATIKPARANTFNGKVTVRFDVRPF